MKKKLSTILFPIALLLFLVAPLLVSAQNDPTMCTITATANGAIVDLSQPICSESGPSIALSVPKVNHRTYLWTDNHSSNTRTSDRIVVKPMETTIYTVTVTDTMTGANCSNSVEVKVWPRFRTEVRQLKLTCSNNESNYGKTAQVQASAKSLSGNSGPFSYKWYNWTGTELPEYQQMEPDNTIAIGLLAHKKYKVKVTDASCGCWQYDSITTRAFPAPVIEFHLDPGDSVYIQNPDVTFSFENLSADSISVLDHTWFFENNIESYEDEPTFTYVEPNDQAVVRLKVVDDCQCDTVFTHQFKVLPVDLKIPSVFTPNNDGHNDTFVITIKSHSQSGNRDGKNPEEKPLSTYYKSTELVVFNRWGRIVYKSNDYQNDWDGGGLSDGTYFYVLKCTGLKEVVQYQGSVMILTK